MFYAGSFSGSAPVKIPFQVGETMANPGVPVVVGGSNNEGVALASTTAAANLVGLTIAAATLLTAQQTGNVDPAAYVEVIVNPDAIYKARLSGGATSGTSLTAYTVTSASTDGLTATSGDDFSSPEFDEGTIYFISGNNKGISRKITGTTSSACTVTVAFPYDIAVGDQFIVVPFAKGELQYVQLTSDLTEINAAVAVDTDNQNFTVLDLHFDGVDNSYARIVPCDSIYGAGAADTGS